VPQLEEIWEEKEAPPASDYGPTQAKGGLEWATSLQQLFMKSIFQF